MAEFDQLVEPDELRYELDEGELIVMTQQKSLRLLPANDDERVLQRTEKIEITRSR